MGVLGSNVGVEEYQPRCSQSNNIEPKLSLLALSSKSKSARLFGRFESQMHSS